MQCCRRQRPETAERTEERVAARPDTLRTNDGTSFSKSHSDASVVLCECLWVVVGLSRACGLWPRGCSRRHRLSLGRTIFLPRACGPSQTGGFSSVPQRGNAEQFIPWGLRVTLVFTALGIRLCSLEHILYDNTLVRYRAYTVRTVSVTSGAPPSWSRARSRRLARGTRARTAARRTRSSRRWARWRTRPWSSPRRT